jgi:hypothetical protein
MDAQLLLKNYGFQQFGHAWIIWRVHLDVAASRSDNAGLHKYVSDQVHFVENVDSSWEYVTATGAPGKLRFKTTDVRDVIAFAQSILAKSVLQASGYPVNEGFDFQGTFYTSPLMFGDYADFKVSRRDDESWALLPEGNYKRAYEAWRNDFAERVLKGVAAAPTNFRLM